MTPPRDDLAARMARTAAGRSAQVDRTAEEGQESQVVASEPQRPARGRGSKTRPVGESSARAFQQAPKPHPRRVTLDLTEDDHRALSIARVEDGVPVSERLRALVQLWRESPEVAEQVLQRARP